VAQFQDPREQAIFQFGRDYERERMINAITIESLEDKYEHPSYRPYRLGLRIAIDILRRLGYIHTQEDDY
jgi:hypothetical protein